MAKRPVESVEAPLVALSVEYDGRIGDGAAREPVDDTAAQRVALGGESRQAASYR